MRAAVIALVLAGAPAAGCNCGDGAGTASPTPSAGAEGESRVLNVGNPARGLDAVPDYDAQAEVLRTEVAPRLPDPVPDTTTACTQMLAAVGEYYGRSERDATRQLAALQATHDAELKACVAETSAAAASCVALLAREQAGEYPWLLDQCSRAFPRSGS